MTRHIKIFEDYSDEDLEDLMGDLEGIGHKHRMIKGEDYGFGEDPKKENTGTETLFLSKFGAEKLKESLKKDFGREYMTTYGYDANEIFPHWQGISGTKTPNSRRTAPLGAHIYENVMHWRYRLLQGQEKEKFPPYIITVSSDHKKFPASHWGRTHVQMGKDRVKKMYDGVIKYIEQMKF